MIAPADQNQKQNQPNKPTRTKIYSQYHPNRFPPFRWRALSTTHTMSRQRHRTLMPRHGGIHTIHIHTHIPLVARACMKTFTQDLVAHPFDHRTARQHCSTTSTSTTTSRTLTQSIYLTHRRNCIRNPSSPHHRIKALPPIPPCRNPNPTRWHQVRHKSWRRRRRASHPAASSRCRPVSILKISVFIVLAATSISEEL